MRFLSKILVLAITPLVLLGQTKDIRFHLTAINEVSGATINDCEFKVYLEPQGAILDLSKDKKSIYYKVQPDQRFKVVAVAKGYYTEETVFHTEDFFDEDVLKLKLNPKQSNNATFKVIDAITKKSIDANLDIFVGNNSTKAKLNNKKLNYVLDFDQPQTVKINAQAAGYESQEQEFELKLNQSNVFTIEMFVKSNNQVVLVTDSDNNYIKKFEFSLNSNPVIQANDAKIELAGRSGDVFDIQVNAQGYVSKTIKYEIGKSGPKIILDKISPFIFEVQDLNGKSVLANIKINSPDNKQINYDFKANYIPSMLGLYTFEIKKEGYITQNLSHDFTNFAQKNDVFKVQLLQETETYNFAIVDAISNEVLQNSQLKVTSDKGVEINVMKSENAYKIITNKNFKGNYQASSEGYQTLKGNINDEKNISIKLVKNTENPKDVIYVFTPLEVKSAKEVANTKIKFYDLSNSEIQAVKKGNSYYITSKTEIPSLKFEVEASGYKAYKSQLVPGKTTNNIMMNELEYENYRFNISDAITNLPITAKVDVQLEQKSLKQEKNNSFLLQNDINNYKYNISAQEYTKITNKDLIKSDAVNNEFNIKLVKESYLVKFIIKNELNASNISAALVKISSDKTLDIAKINTKNSFSNAIIPGVKYQLTLSLPDFQNYSESFALEMATKPELEYFINLTPKIKEIVKPAELPIEKPAEKPAVVVVKPEPKIIEEPTNLPENIHNLTSGKKYRLNGVNFEQSKAVLIAGSEKQLKILSDYLKAHKNQRIEITGHTDNEGSIQLNQNLSLFRAKLVSNYLFNNGIDENRIMVFGKGSSMPLVPNDNEESKAKNRRVEVEVFEN